MFGKMHKLISVLLLLAMMLNGTAVFAEEIITIAQDGFEELFFEEELSAEETEEQTKIDFDGMTIENEEVEIDEEEEEETDLAQIPMSLADYDANGFLIGNGVLEYYNGPGGDIVIPAGVTRIAPSAFRYCDELISVEIPEAVTAIGDYAFQYCSNLRSVVIHGKETHIGNSAFEVGYESKLNVVVDKGSYAADWCKVNDVFYTYSGKDYKDSFTIKNGVATYYTGNEQVVKFPKGITAIGENACSSWNNLGIRYGIEEIVLPEGLKKIGKEAFIANTNLKKMNFPSTLKTIEMYAFQSCGFTELTIPKTLKLKADFKYMGIFMGCWDLKKITLQNGLASMGIAMFDSCHGLEEVYLPGSLECVGGNGFMQCENLKKVVIGDGIKLIDGLAFAYSYNLTDVVIPSSVKTIAYQAFVGCTGLRSLTIPASVTRIEEEVFLGCSEDLVINCVAGSAAQKYCKKNGIKYNAICNHKWNSAKITLAATCTENGEKTRSCKVCGEKEILTIPAKGHKEVTLKAVQVSCKQDGLSEGKKCSTCGAITVEQIVTPALPHDIVIDAYIAPSETACGRTEGSHCAVCKSVLVAQEVIPGLMPAIGLVNKSTKGITLNVGDYWLLKPEYAEEKGWKITKWSTNAKKIATVDKDGVICAKAEGSVTITASAGKNKTMTAKFKIVDPKKPTKVSLNLKGTQTLNLGETLELKATLAPETAEAKFSWKTSSKKIATVSAEGIVTPVAEGTATITVTATRGKVKKTASVKVKVVDPLKLTKVTLDKTGTQTLAKGETLTLNPTLNPEGTEATIKWKSSNKSVASVKDGVITANKKGKAVITVTAIRGKVTKTAKVTIQVK